MNVSRALSAFSSATVASRLRLRLHYRGSASARPEQELFSQQEERTSLPARRPRREAGEAFAVKFNVARPPVDLTPTPSEQVGQ